LSRRRSFPCIPAALIAAAGLLSAAPAAHAQTWTKVVANPPGAINLMVLLSDGSVMCAANNGSTIGRGWYKLTPNAAGSYINGTWTTLANMIDTRLYYSTQVLMDGRVFIAGGEYGTGGAKAEIYNPLLNTWTAVNPPITLLDPNAASPLNGSTQKFYDSNSEILPNGNILISPVLPKVLGEPLIYNPNTNTWVAGPHYFRGVYQDEASWVKLTDNTILTIDPFGTFSERYNPVSNTWINDGVVPVGLYDAFGSELGGAVLLPDGRAFFLGATGQTALYTPTGTTAPGTWIAGPVIPGARGTPDAPCCIMVNGKVLCAVSPVPTSANHFPPPTTFLEYDSATNTFAAAPAPVGANDPVPTYVTAMLQLPNGQVLFSHMNTTVYAYTPAGAPLAAGKPVIQTITANGDGSFHLTGTGINGISEGASYGDDLQMNSNYPIVRCTHSNGNIYYGRTFNWSSTSVRTGAAVLSTEYRLNSTMPPGAYSLVVVGNGFASDPVSSPTVGSAPTSQNGCIGDSASFSTAGAGMGPFTYQWRRGTTNLVNGGSISGATLPTLNINPIAAGDLGTDYNCVITSALGSVTTGNVGLACAAPSCYANCDGSSTPPVLTANDFQCFLNKFAAADPTANCDGSTAAPILTANDFQCFLNAYSVGCT